MAKDYYKILGVDRDADKDQIKKAYRKLSFKYHPDQNKGDKAAEEKFKEISEAYAVLYDDEKRQQYDSFGAEGFGQRFSHEDIFRGFDFSSVFSEFGFGGEDILSQLFGRPGRGQRQRPGFGGMGAPPQKGQDYTAQVEISLEESVRGGQRTLTIPDTGERVSVKIPAGIRAGKRLRVPGKGGPSMMGGPRGDLFMKVEIAPHPVFRRVKDDLFVKKRVSLADAALGGSVNVATMEGSEVTVKIPPGTQPGTKLRLKAKGVTGLRGKEAGNLFVEIVVSIPKELTDEQRELFEKLREEGL